MPVDENYNPTLTRQEKLLAAVFISVATKLNIFSGRLPQGSEAAAAVTGLELAYKEMFYKCMLRELDLTHIDELVEQIDKDIKRRGLDVVQASALQNLEKLEEFYSLLNPKTKA